MIHAGEWPVDLKLRCAHRGLKRTLLPWHNRFEVPGYGRLDAGKQDGQLIDQFGRKIETACSVDENVQGEVEIMLLRIEQETGNKLTLRTW